MRAVLDRPVVRQLWKFALVGGVGFVVDTVSFTLLRLTPAFEHSPLKAGIISAALAIAANWLGNRYWTFGPHRSRRGLMEAVEFFGVSLLGTLVALGCLAFSHYVLGLVTVLEDNISKNVVGLVLGSAIRFVLYRSWVYHPGRKHRAVVSAEEPAAVE
ncbi:GtrA family protein [Amnibacterium kyonggiense]|uniref:Putative flippase GtrA n=1 Tax=Amnibacterium kyonggiense TaxID=595671 RepID=A0A4R7FIY6_9MICO|nr:GtrA family protein [Amnibacterium kyonggiense]TDS74992.1 putative flippase GtrA [Amnibacterium kyonggiense]